MISRFSYAIHPVTHLAVSPLATRASSSEGRDSPLISHKLIHTGQHYDDRMSRSFFQALGIPEADINLGVGSGTHAEQVGHTMIALEKVFEEEKPDWVVVVGDVNATLAATVSPIYPVKSFIFNGASSSPPINSPSKTSAKKAPPKKTSSSLATS